MAEEGASLNERILLRQRATMCRCLTRLLRRWPRESLLILIIKMDSAIQHYITLPGMLQYPSSRKFLNTRIHSMRAKEVATLICRTGLINIRRCISQ
ncbi:hypothetical protein RSOL_190470 [Rhizoctonia solani AG-3 Rhs1AP]|uniref:Uncharacterized protein n=1 Tax=Rhizoctonia solani AG-3 Rhs1AP TaxID=1086054 RepID=X8J3T5_9AGAM|nr:hypothetical protein RSOL_190470 [Rhizoctonia solani AG-3 Rhs1AP]